MIQGELVFAAVSACIIGSETKEGASNWGLQDENQDIACSHCRQSLQALQAELAGIADIAMPKPWVTFMQVYTLLRLSSGMHKFRLS
jgi:hypothetical protein